MHGTMIIKFSKIFICTQQ